MLSDQEFTELENQEAAAWQSVKEAQAAKDVVSAVWQPIFSRLRDEKLRREIRKEMEVAK